MDSFRTLLHFYLICVTLQLANGLGLHILVQQPRQVDRHRSAALRFALRFQFQGKSLNHITVKCRIGLDKSNQMMVIQLTLDISNLRTRSTDIRSAEAAAPGDGPERDRGAPAAAERGQPAGARPLLHRHHLPHLKRPEDRPKHSRGTCVLHM